MFTKQQYLEASNQIHDDMGMDDYIKFCQLNAELIQEALKIAAGV